MKGSAFEGEEEFDLRIEVEEGESGLKRVTITALQAQGEIDLAMEYPRIKKLLERDWLSSDSDEGEG